MSDDEGFPAPPDGARLADLRERRAWLGQPLIAQVLPRSGALLLPDHAHPTCVIIEPGRIEARSGDDKRSAEIPPRLVASWNELWPELWIANGEPAAGVLVLLHHRGLFRIADALGTARVDAWVAAALHR